jgi:hypothetical protein
MNKRTYKFICFLLVFIISSSLGCAGGTRGKLKRVQKPTENELRQEWNDYTVYYRRNLALIYKIKNNQKIMLDGSWIEVTSDDMMNNAKILDSAWVKEIIGENDKMFGYLVHTYRDRAYAGIIDENTVKLNYTYVRTSGGP